MFRGELTFLVADLDFLRKGYQPIHIAIGMKPLEQDRAEQRKLNHASLAVELGDFLARDADFGF